jgi:hypothetical protein
MNVKYFFFRCNARAYLLVYMISGKRGSGLQKVLSVTILRYRVAITVIFDTNWEELEGIRPGIAGIRGRHQEQQGDLEREQR